MDIVRLETFLLLSKLGSFTEVANQMYCSQPAVSKQIKTLEEDLGVALFNRIGKKNHLTIQGEYFKPYAQEIINTYARAKEHILQLENLEEGTIRFGATNFIGVYLIPEILAIFRNRFPKIEVDFTISSSKKLIALLQNDAIEFAFMSGYIDLVSERFIIKKICDDNLKIIVNASHNLANKKTTTIKAIQNETFVLKGETSSLYKFLQNRIGPDACMNNIMLKISSQEGIKEAVIQNLGISVMSEKAVKHEMDLGLIKTLDLENIDLTRSINLIYNKKHNLTPAAKEFFKCLKC